VIDFRYHLVSIIAVFLALAVGIAVGANALRPATEAFLSKAASEVSKKNNSLTQQNAMLQQQINADQAFAQAGSTRLLAHLLTGQSAVLVTAPGADSSTISGIKTALGQAGATVTGQVNLSSHFFDDSAPTEEALSTLAQQLKPAGVSLPGQTPDAQIAGQQAAAQLIAASVVSKDAPALTTAQSQEVLSGFANQGYLQVSAQNGGTTLPPATLAVVVIPSTPPAAGDSSPANLGLIAMAVQLQGSGRGTVLAGPVAGSGSGSAIDEVVSGSGQVSTVDNADTEVGQIIVAQALAELLAGHPAASFGIAPGTAPSPAPTPSGSSSAIPSVTPSATVTRQAGGR